MNRQEVIEQLQVLKEAVNKSDFSNAFSGTTEKLIEDAAVQLLEQSLGMFELSVPSK